MTCYKPMAAFRDGSLNPETGRPAIKIGKAPFGCVPLSLPCGQCIGCRLERARMWSLRLMHEKQGHEQSSFVTLTYGDDNLPSDYSLKVADFQKFMKRLRKNIHPKKIKMFHSGEYGDDFQRPHYHAIILGHDFLDRRYLCTNKGNIIYTSEELLSRWQLGHCTVQDVTLKSAAYVAKYCIKKINGKKAETHYLLDVVDPATGEIKRYNRKPEYMTCSKELGLEWLKKYKTDVYPHGYVVAGGTLQRPPRYYDEKYSELFGPEVVDQLRKARRDYARDHAENSTPERLAVRERVQELRQAISPRKLK